MPELLHVRLHAAGPARRPAGRPRRPRGRDLPRAAPAVADRRRHGARRPGRCRGRRPHRTRPGAGRRCVAAVAAAVADRADPRARAHQRGRRPGRAVLRRHRGRRRAHLPVAGAARRANLNVVPVRRHHHHQPRRPVWSSRPWPSWSSARPGPCARACSPWPTTRSTPARPGCRSSALNLVLAVLTAVTVVVSMRVVGPAADQRPDDRAQRRGAAARRQLPLGDPGRRAHRRARPAWAAISRHASTPTPRPVARSSSSRSRCSCSAPPRPGCGAACTPGAHRVAEGGTTTSTGAGAATPPSCTTATSTTCTTGTARPARGPLRRARAGLPRPAGPRLRRPGPRRRRKGLTMAEQARRPPGSVPRSRRTCSDDTDDFTSAQDLTRGCESRAARRPGHGLPHPAGDGGRR